MNNFDRMQIIKRTARSVIAYFEHNAYDFAPISAEDLVADFVAKKSLVKLAPDVVADLVKAVIDMNNGQKTFR